MQRGLSHLCARDIFARKNSRNAVLGNAEGALLAFPYSYTTRPKLLAGDLI